MGFVSGWDLLVRGWFVQIVQEGGKASLRDHISLEGGGENHLQKVL